MQVILAEQCPYCTKFRSPADIVQLTPEVIICGDCLHRHEEALRSLSTGKPPAECSECHRTWEQLRELAPGSDKQLSMACHFENGLYRFMCMACDAVYVPKRAELYGGTPFAKERGI